MTKHDYYQSFEGLVLFKRPYKEKDLLVKILTRDFGKRMFFIKGGLSPNHPLTAQVQAFSRSQFLGHLTSSGFSFLKEGASLYQPKNIYESIDLQAHMAYCCQLADACIEDFQADGQLFDYLAQSIEDMDQRGLPLLVDSFFELKVLSRFGVAFDWKACAVCGRTSGSFDISSKFHGLLCHEHVGLDPYVWHQDPKAVHVCRVLASLETPRKLGQVRLSDQTLEEVRDLMDKLYDEHVGIHLKSKNFLRQMDQWQSQLSLRQKPQDTSQEKGQE